MTSHRKYKFPKLIKRILIFLSVLTIVLIFAANKTVEHGTRNMVYADINALPYSKAGLLLGTSQYLANGQQNLYFTSRIRAAYELYKSGKISALVISGDNSVKHYNEPEDMKNALVRLGVPDSVIYLDYAGFRTYDSVIRMHKIFGQTSFTVISQRFHNERAVYIAQRLGLQAVGFNAKDVNAYNGFKTNVREKLARVKVFLDLLTNKQPKFLGEKIEIK